MGRDRLRTLAIVLALIGLGVTIYLAYAHYFHKTVACGVGGHGCNTVQNSPYAILLGVPLSVYGLASYLGILVSLLADNDFARALATFLALVGFGLSIYLLYREIFTIKAFCIWCTVSLGVITVLLPVTVVRFLRGGTPSPGPAS